jgi:hypothetical protein
MPIYYGRKMPDENKMVAMLFQSERIVIIGRVLFG